MIPYGHQWIDADDEQAVLEVLRSDWLTTGPKVDEFEQAICAFTDAKHGVAVSPARRRSTPRSTPWASAPVTRSWSLP